MWTVYKINGVSVETELTHLQGGTIIKLGGRRRVYTYFVRGHRGWHDVRLRRTEPGRYTGLLSQSLCRITDKTVK
jgi:hypothetical protein